MNESPNNTRKLALSAVVAAAYAVLTIFLAPISYSSVQCRISEVLCILPFFLPSSAWGLFAGCLLANLITGNALDIAFGSLATLGAALVTARLGRMSHSVKTELLACFQPVIFNAVIVGAVLTWGEAGLNPFTHPGVYAVTALWVGLGEAIVLFAIGFSLMRWLPKQRFFRKQLQRFQ